jgi:hypothetical protein
MQKCKTKTRESLLATIMMLSVALICASMLPAPFVTIANAQKRRTVSSAKKNIQTEATKAAGELAQRRAELIKAVNDSKASLAQLLVYREASFRAATKERDQLRELYAQGLIARQKIEESETKMAAAQSEVNKVRSDMKAADTEIAHINETIAEEKAAAQLASAPPLARGSFVKTTSYVRYEGAGGFSLLADAGKITNFFAARFKHSPPISAFGQTTVHDHLGFDHRNAMDVAVHPDSLEGIALIDYLRRAGIPFIAFRSAVPGSATGAHIHIGKPSHRL